MAIPPISARPMGGTGPIARPTMAPTGGQPAAGQAGATDEAGFGKAIADALGSVQETHQVADGLAQQAATGQLENVHDYMIAATQAQLATELTVAVRNKALESFNEIMRMQV
ncbi:flagellar hook-basal body complex protein FliE [Euzebya rosea]|uniref:flagellar hook-basal body complex protein FliE n=1 Tax=Euzebya rosea TaxID=2052804 RepID=UPI00196A7CED|nr:flagellar hook-basal body complex protein FliE [Euzebya rosea]